MGLCKSKNVYVHGQTIAPCSQTLLSNVSLQMAKMNEITKDLGTLACEVLG